MGSELGRAGVSEEGRGIIPEWKRSRLWKLWERSPVRKIPAVLHSSKEAAALWNMGSTCRNQGMGRESGRAEGQGGL